MSPLRFPGTTDRVPKELVAREPWYSSMWKCVLSLLFTSFVSGYQLPRTPYLNPFGLGLSRRETAAILLGGAAWCSSTIGSNDAVATTPSFKSVRGATSNGDAAFRLEVRQRNI